MLGLKGQLDLSYLPDYKKKEVTALLDIFREIDKKIDLFRAKASLSCVPGCGNCCRDACVGVSVLEVQPLAVYLLQSKKADHWLERINPEDERARCVFYSREQLSNGGHCSVYPYRPLLCRLFGFASRVTEKKDREIMLCKEIKNYFPQEVQRVQSQSKIKSYSPVSSEFAIKAYGVSMDLANDFRNINIAVKRAVEIIGYHEDLFRKYRKKGSEQTWLTRTFRKKFRDSNLKGTRKKLSKFKYRNRKDKTSLLTNLAADSARAPESSA